MNSNHILSQVENGIGRITLNRPEAYNALTTEMVRQISTRLEKWETDDAVKCVVFDGAGDTAFCSGGDLKQFYRSGWHYRQGEIEHSVATVFFKEEYELNAQIAHYPKPTIAYMNGITMGGGYGIAGHCSFRIATPQTKFAMPEVQIGFFPDVGSVYHLLQTPEHFGTYLALTGDIINATDMIAATLADYHIVSSSNDLCFLMAETDLSEDSLTAIFEAAHIPPNQNSFYLNNKPSFNKIFDGYRLPKIMASLKDLKDDFAKRTLALIEGASPISVLVAAEHLRRSQNLSLDEILAVDLHLAGQFIQNYDLYEGIRAKMIEKDNLPQWEIADMKTIDNNQVQSYFET